MLKKFSNILHIHYIHTIVHLQLYLIAADSNKTDQMNIKNIFGGVIKLSISL